MHLCPNLNILFRMPHVNSSSISAHTNTPPPPSRRRRPLRVEPVIFAVLLAVLTLGINLAGEPAHGEHADTKAQASRIASAR